jgi:hypothetical protein
MVKRQEIENTLTVSSASHHRSRHEVHGPLGPGGEDGRRRGWHEQILGPGRLREGVRIQHHAMTAGLAHLRDQPAGLEVREIGGGVLEVVAVARDDAGRGRHVEGRCAGVGGGGGGGHGEVTEGFDGQRGIGDLLQIHDRIVWMQQLRETQLLARLQRDGLCGHSYATRQMKAQ